MTLGSIIDALGDHQPEPAAPGDLVAEDEILAVDEQQKQRQAMERELRSQAAALDPTARHEVHKIPAAAPVDTPERDRVRTEDLPVERLLSLRGRPLLAADGSEIGRISDVYLDEATGIPEWFGAQVGSLMGSRRVVVPVFGAYVLADAVSVPYTREVIVAATVSAGSIDTDQESDLYRHFGIPRSLERSPTGLPAGLDIPRPSRWRRWLRDLMPGRRTVAATAITAGTVAAIGATVAVGRHKTGSH